MGWQSLSESTPVARTQHRCIWCGQFILVGEKYTKSIGIFDGDFQSNVFHMECVKACWEDLSENHEDTFEPYEYKRGSREQKGCGQVILQ